MSKKVIPTAELSAGGLLPLAQCIDRLGFEGYATQIDLALQRCESAVNWTAKQSVTEVLNAIIVTRDNQKAAMRTKMARFPSLSQTIEAFDFTRLNDKLIEVRVRELAECDWIRCKTNLYFHGAPGLGKTHLSIALGIRATQKAYSTLFLSAKDLFKQLNDALEDGVYERKINSIQRNELLIIDDLGNGIKSSPNNAQMFYELIDGRAGKKSTIITSNRDITDWVRGIGGDSVSIRAAMDRFLGNCRDFNLHGNSYRIAQFVEQRRKDWGTETPARGANRHDDGLSEMMEAIE